MLRFLRTKIGIVKLLIVAGLALLLFVVLKPKPETLATTYSKKIPFPSYMTAVPVDQSCPLNQCPQKQMEYQYTDITPDADAWSDFAKLLVQTGYKQTKKDGVKEYMTYMFEGSSSNKTCDTLYIGHSTETNHIELECRFNDELGRAIHYDPIEK